MYNPVWHIWIESVHVYNLEARVYSDLLRGRLKGAHFKNQLKHLAN